MDNQEIVAYTMVGGFTSVELSNKVNNMMQMGWQIYGHPFTILEEVLQPMIRYKQNNEQETNS